MSNKQDSNVIHVDFQSRQAQNNNGTKLFSQLIGNIVNPSDESLDEWSEDLTPKERCDQLKLDLEFLRKMNVTL